MAETTKSERCQVRSGTDNPCPRPAVVEIGGVPFCEPCAREQEAYFAKGELTDHPRALRDDEPLVGVLDRALRNGRRTSGDHEPDAAIEVRAAALSSSRAPLACQTRR